MSEPTKHHFVPQIYLKRFTYNKYGDVYTLKHKLKYSKVVSKNKSQICYEPNRYKFDNPEILGELETNDDNIIEKNAFNYESSELTYLFDKIDHNQPLLKSEFNKLIFIILHIKFRNPKFSEDYISLSTQQTSKVNNEINLLRRQAINYCVLNGFDTSIVDKALENIIEKHKDLNYVKNSYLKTILDETAVSKKLIEDILEWDLKIYYTDYNKPFLTSDNPGYTINSNDKPFNTNFGEVSVFTFPISPRSMLVLIRTNKKKDLDIYKRYIKRKADNRLVIKFNLGTMKMANEMVISNLKEEPLIVKDLYFK